MKKQIQQKLYDTENCQVLFSSEDRNCCTYPKGVRFDFAVLCQTPEGEFFLHGKGFWGCNTIVPLSKDQADFWINCAKNSQIC